MENDQCWKKKVFESVRITLYAILILNGVFIQYFAKFRYLCNYQGYSCPLCGMRTAIDCLLSCDFSGAIESNYLVVIVIGLIFFIIIDTISIVYRRIQKK